ncbi:hypothetical protein OESDEN_10232 [Oesophagostomum dentatum]|uniref:Uncharacterized protein n=1 Tax=Oesophagostomum dentatum TaxID=61180 RepID=A0A0B1T3E7_OESDE|nr:hypothetical protein OESDEN_10232 [Oesophagostomum dentatum]
MTALRMLLFDDSVDNAVTAKSGFYDLQRRKFYCEDKKMIKRLFKKYGFVCHEIPVDYFEANDRVVMAAHMPEAESDLRRYIHAAMDSRIKYRDHNYVVGY